ncbi:MAG: alanine racemase [Hyphomicrobiaceae bacterium]
MHIADLETPCLLLDVERLDANQARMAGHLVELGVSFRPHMKTAKSIDVARRIMPPEAKGARITVSTLKEADYFASHGYRDILYAVGIAPGKLGHAAQLVRQGVNLVLTLDNLEAARQLVEHSRDLGVSFRVVVEIDSDGHRSGVKPGDPLLVEIARTLKASLGCRPVGVMTHAGESYNCGSIDEIRAMAERERAAVAHSARLLAKAGFQPEIVSVGSTPTATFAERLDGVTEVRAGVYMFQDLVMAGLGVCQPEDIALTVLTTVIGHQRDKGWIITDGGWMAMSRDRGTARQSVDCGYGRVADRTGRLLDDLIVADANQEHGIVRRRQGGALDVERFPVGTLLRVLPNHACATAAQYDRYHVLEGGREVVAEWPRINGW